jgi:hypothetical protein
MADAEYLPRADRAVVPREKLEGYLLNLGHEVGRHKARVFGTALGIHRGDWEFLRDGIVKGVSAAPVSTVRETPWGRLYEVVVSIEGLNDQTRRVMTVWLVASVGDPPRFVTGYVVEPPPNA